MTTLDELRARFSKEKEEEPPRISELLSPQQRVVAFHNLQGCPECHDAYPEMSIKSFPISRYSTQEVLTREMVYVWACHEGHTQTVRIAFSAIEAELPRPRRIQVMRLNHGALLPLNGSETPQEGDRLLLPMGQGVTLSVEIAYVEKRFDINHSYYTCDWTWAGERNGKCTVMAGVCIGWTEIQGGASIQMSDAHHCASCGQPLKQHAAYGKCPSLIAEGLTPAVLSPNINVAQFKDMPKGTAVLIPAGAVLPTSIRIPYLVNVDDGDLAVESAETIEQRLMEMIRLKNMRDE